MSEEQESVHVHTGHQRNAIHAMLLAFTEDAGQRTGLLMCVISEIFAFETEPKEGEEYGKIIHEMADKILENVKHLKTNIESMKKKVTDAVMEQAAKHGHKAPDNRLN